MFPKIRGLDEKASDRKAHRTTYFFIETSQKSEGGQQRYFYQLLAEGEEQKRLSLSATYRDAGTNQYCLTAGQFIANGQRLLLLDIDATSL